MTQIETPGVRPPRTFGAMAGALVFLLLVVLGWVGFRALTSDHKATPVPTVDWTSWVKAGRADGKLAVLAPAKLPTGWRATSAIYESGTSPHWRMGMLTGSGKFVGIEESLRSTDDLVHEFVDENAVRGEDATLADGQTWQTWTDSGGDFAVVRTLKTPAGEQERILVYGSAPDASIREFAGALAADSVPTS